jgi:signal transduction histidine kinase
MSTKPQKRKILVIEDDPALRQTIWLVLRAKGHDVLDAEDGRTGLQITRSHRPDLIISDINMPGLDGWGMLHELRATPETAALPCILMTGDSDDMSLRRGMESGADDYLPKPFTMDTLMAAVEARLRKMDAVKQQAEVKLSELRSNLSLMLPHELNTPLVGIMGFGTIISTCADTLSPQELAEMGQGIIESGNRLKRLIQNFLLYTQLELLGTEVRDLHLATNRADAEAVSHITDTATRRAAHHKRETDLNLQLGKSHTAISADLLGKIAEELVDNAFKFSTPGSPVIVTTSTPADGFRLVVADRGRGFKPEHISQVNAYVQFDRKLHEQQGSGLGLTIAKRLAELHGGSLKITSDGITGTSVEVRLPIARH